MSVSVYRHNLVMIVFKSSSAETMEVVENSMVNAYWANLELNRDERSLKNVFFISGENFSGIMANAQWWYWSWKSCASPGLPSGPIGGAGDWWFSCRYFLHRVFYSYRCSLWCIKIFIIFFSALDLVLDVSLANPNNQLNSSFVNHADATYTSSSIWSILLYFVIDRYRLDLGRVVPPSSWGTGTCPLSMHWPGL